MLARKSEYVGCICLSVCLPVCPSVYLSVRQSVRLFASLSVNVHLPCLLLPNVKDRYPSKLPVCMMVSFPAHLYMMLSVHDAICVYDAICVNPSVHDAICVHPSVHDAICT